MSYYLSQSPLLQEFIHQMAKNNEDEFNSAIKDLYKNKRLLTSYISSYI